MELHFKFYCVVVEECKRQLIEKNFTELKERDSWEIKPGGLVSQWRTFALHFYCSFLVFHNQ